MGPQVPPQPAPIMSGGVASVLGAQGAVAGQATAFPFTGSTGSAAGASMDFEREKRPAYWRTPEQSTVESLKYHNDDLAHHKEQGRKVIEAFKESRYKNNPWVQDMIKFYEENGGRPPRERDQGGFRSWQEVWDQFEDWKNNPDGRDKATPQMRKWPRGGRR